MELAGRYRLERVLGSGALGDVWKAEDRLHDRPVAIKFLKSQVVASSPVLLRKFQQEARIGAVLGHPGIVQVDDFGEYDGRWYLVMEFLNGRNLQAEIDDHPRGLPLARLLSLGVQIADALAAAHARGIVHRDLKPANIMVTGPQQETTKICDFGIAHLAEVSTINTLSGKSAGTPVYMAPEQWLGEKVDARTDLYALGGTLFTLLTGAPAFAGSLLALKAQHLDTPPTPPDELRSDLPTGLAPLMVQLLAKDPDDRPPSATEVTERLRRLTVPTTPTAAIRRPGAETVEWFPPPPEPAAPTRPGPVEQAPHTLEGTAPHAGSPTRRTVLLSLGATALFVPAVYLLTRTSAGSSQTDRTRPPRTGATPPPVAGEPLAGHTDVVTSVAFSPDGNTLASGSYDKTVRLWNVADHSQIGSLGHTDNVYSVAFSPNGKTLASSSKDDIIRLWNVADRTQDGKPLIAISVISVAFSPDGKTLASSSQYPMILLWNVARRTEIGALNETLPVVSVAFSPDGKILASGGHDDMVWLWKPAQRTRVGKPLTGHTENIYSVAFSPDGKILASGSQDTTVRLWNVADRTQIGKPLIGHTDAVNSVAFSPDGKTLASGGLDATVRLWNVASGTQIGKPLTGHVNSVTSVAFSPDGKTLASGSYDRTVRLWRLRA